MKSENEREKSQGRLRHIDLETSFYYPAFHDIPNLSMIELRGIKYSAIPMFFFVRC